MQENPEKVFGSAQEIVPESIRADIENNFPEFVDASMRYEGEASDSRAFVVNDEWIFRFGKKENAAGLYEKEATILPHLQEKLSVPVPHIVYRGIQKETGFAIAGHKMLKGNPLSHPTSEQIAELGTFLNQLRSIDPEEALSWGLEESSRRERYERRLGRARNIVYPALEKELPENAETVQNRTEAIFAEYLENEQNFNSTPVVSHGDLGPGHILVDPTTKKISGIYDWGDMCLTDPDYEIWRLYEKFGDTFLNELLTHIKHGNPDDLRKKLKFFSKGQKVWRVVEKLKETDPKERHDALISFQDSILEN